MIKYVETRNNFFNCSCQNEDFIFDLEDEVKKTSRTFSLNNSKQENILIEELKKNCRKLVKEKTGKKPYTNINLVRV